MAADIVALRIKVWIALPVKLCSVVNLVFCAAAPFHLALTVTFLAGSIFFGKALSFLVLARTLLHHAACERVSTRSEAKRGAFILIYFIV